MTDRRRMSKGDPLGGIRISALEREQARAMLSAAEAIVDSLLAVHHRAKALLTRDSRATAA